MTTTFARKVVSSSPREGFLTLRLDFSAMEPPAIFDSKKELPDQSNLAVSKQNSSYRNDPANVYDPSDATEEELERCLKLLDDDNEGSLFQKLNGGNLKVKASRGMFTGAEVDDRKLLSLPPIGFEARKQTNGDGQESQLKGLEPIPAKQISHLNEETANFPARAPPSFHHSNSLPIPVPSGSPMSFFASNSSYYLRQRPNNLGHKRCRPCPIDHLAYLQSFLNIREH